MQVVLVLFRSDGERRSFSVVRNMTIIGRREDCDLRIPVGDVSRKHCRLVRTDDGIRIEDLGSSNGTYVNGQRIQESELAAGDTVGVGPVQFIVQIDGVPDESDMSAPGARVAPAQPIEEEVPQDELVTEELEEVAAGEHFHVEDEPAVVEEETPVMELDELPTEEAVLEQEPLAEAPAEELEEFPLDDEPLEEAPLEALPAEAHAPAAVASAVDLEEFELEEAAPAAELTKEHEPVAETPAELDDFELEEAPPEPVPVAAETPAAEPELSEEEFELDAEPVADAPAAGPELTEDLEGFELEEEPVAEAPAAEPVVDELELTDEHLESPAPPTIQSPPDSVGELEFEDEALEFEETHPATPTAVSPVPEEDPLELAPASPAYAPVDIDAADDEIDELELDEATTNGEAAAEGAGDSSWDFVIEETDATRSHHDFKLDLDSPHEQPHGK